jgi:Spy/CpxP family protein refolding chaperone
MKNFITFLFVFLFMFSFSQERERMSKEQYRAAQKLFLLEKLNLDPNSEEKFTSIYFETQEKIYIKMMSYRKIKRDLYKNDSADSDECNALIKKMYDIKRDELDIREGMMQELSKIISVDKVLRLPRIEEDFRITMINKIRGNNN